MGSIFKSLERINFGKDIGDALRAMRKQKRDEENLAKLGQLYSDTENLSNQEYETTGVDNMTFRQGNKGSLGKLLNFGTNAISADQTEPGDFILGDVGKPIAENMTDLTPENRIPNANRNAMKQLKNFYAQTMNIPDVDQNMVERMGSLLKMQMDVNQPIKPESVEIGAFNPEYDLRDKKTGKLISEGRAKEKPFDIEGSYKNSETKTYWTYDKQTGKTIDTKIPYDPHEGKTTVNLPENPMDISTQQKDLTITGGDYKLFQRDIDDSVKKIEALREDFQKATPERKGTIRQEIAALETKIDEAESQKELALNEIKGVTDQTANKLNSKYPGFEKLYNILFQHPDIKSSPKNIDKVVDAELGEAPDDIKRWMKNLLKSRIF